MDFCQKIKGLFAEEEMSQEEIAKRLAKQMIGGGGDLLDVNNWLDRVCCPKPRPAVQGAEETPPVYTIWVPVAGSAWDPVNKTQETDKDVVE